MNEDKLISAEDLKKRIKRFIKSWNTDTPYGGGRVDSYNFVIKAIDEAPAVKTYCYFCGQTEHGKVINDTVKIEITEHHTFAKPDDVEDLDFPNSKSSEDK